MVIRSIAQSLSARAPDRHGMQAPAPCQRVNTPKPLVLSPEVRFRNALRRCKVDVGTSPITAPLRRLHPGSTTGVHVQPTVEPHERANKGGHPEEAHGHPAGSTQTAINLAKHLLSCQFTHRADGVAHESPHAGAEDSTFPIGM